MFVICPIGVCVLQAALDVWDPNDGPHACMCAANEVVDAARVWSLIFVAIGVGALIASVVGSFSFDYMGQKLGQRVRILMFSALLKQVCGIWVRGVADGNGGSLKRG